MGRPCAFFHAQPAEYPKCPFCLEVVNGEPDRPGPYPVQAPNKNRLRRQKCAHRGLEVLEVQQCQTCTKTVPVDIHPCALHGRCSLEILTKDPAVKVCSNCPDYVPGVDLGRIVLINLDRRIDRLAEFAARAKTAQLPDWQRQSATDGNDIPYPHDWKGGSGAYGCKLSHLKVIERALADKVPILTVFEDDCEFVADFSMRLQEFWPLLPNDWQGIMLGGQGGRRPRPDVVAEGIKRTQNAQRTHAYVLRGPEIMKSVYRIWSDADTHIDHSNFLWQQSHGVYQPDPLLCFQAASKSDITGREEPDRTWGAA